VSLLSKSNIKADLHLHTTYSDGAYSPYELVRLVHNAGISVIGIADHDNIQGLDDAIQFAKEFDIEVIPSVELSSTLNNKDVHILGYFVDYKHHKLNEYLTFFRNERKRRAERIVAKLNNLNIPLKFDSVHTKSEFGSIGRPHVAYALLEGGYIGSYDEAFEKYIGVNCPAYEEKVHFSPKDAIELISNAGGLSFLAHPNRLLNENELLFLIKCGLDGIEVVHPSHNQERERYFRGIINEYFLLESGGSDFHGGKRNDEGILGRFIVPYQVVENMKLRL
jgi:predicted metal-dependent phosphoesterase TrpH